MSFPDRNEPSPAIEVVDGIGAEYLVWTRDRIVELLARVDELERRAAAHDRSLRSAFDAIGP